MIHFRDTLLHYDTLWYTLGYTITLYTMIHFRIYYDTLLYTLGYTMIHFRIHYYTL